MNVSGVDWFYLVSGGYALLTLSLGLFEIRRTKYSGPDLITAFIVIYVVQCCLPGMIIYACLPVTGLDLPTANHAFDRIYSATDLPAAVLVLGLTIWFPIFFYVFLPLIDRCFRRLWVAPARGSWLLLGGSSTRLSILLIVGLVITMAFFFSLGDSFISRYTNLILFRDYSDQVQSDRLSEFAYSLTQSWGWLSVVALFVVYERRGRSGTWFFCLACAIIFAILCVSRRALFIPILLSYLTFVLFDGRWRAKLLVLGAIPVLMLIAFGKDVFGAIAYGGTLDAVAGRYDTLASGLLRTASDIGITVVESIGTINLLHLEPRFGIDHLLSIVRRFPASWFGTDVTFPIRVVRLSTAAFGSADEQDIPPGFLGQMWLDFRVAGPLVWGFAFAFQVGVVQRLFAVTVRTRQATAAFVLLTFVISLPINSGSYDFSFSADICVLLLGVLMSFKFARLRVKVMSAGDAGPIAQGSEGHHPTSKDELRGQ